MVAQMVTPVLTSSFTTAMTSFAVYESRPDVGSCMPASALDKAARFVGEGGETDFATRVRVS